MNAVALSDLETLAVGLFAIVVATAMARRIPSLARLNLPAAVLGGLLVAFIAGLLRQFAGTTIQFASPSRTFSCSSSSPRSDCQRNSRR